MKNKVYITYYSSASSLGIEKNRIVNALLVKNPEAYYPGENEFFKKSFFKIPYDYNEFPNETRSSSIIIKLIKDIEDFFKENKKVPLFLATSTGGIDITEKEYKNLLNGVSNFSPFKGHFFNKISDDIKSMFPDFFTDFITFSTACSSSGHAIFQAFRLIKNGIIDKAVIIGVDILSLTTLIGFDSLQLVSPTVTKPLSKLRDGITLGEGGGIIVLENKKRNTDDFEIIGGSSTSDGYHISSPDPEGFAQKKCILNALKEADIDVKDIDYVNAHGTGTEMNDKIEIKVLKELFGERIIVNSLKGFIGHTLGASAIVEIAILNVILRENKIVQPKNFVEPIDSIVAPETIDREVKYILKNSFGFGGNNVTLIMKK